ncbi:MAG: hypothetical protein DDG58_11140 [Ardenticatenia bacterium]|nr:MAG: hypothetical protein DDG58_11140 [Ardenticatenia bacterium]
MDVSDDDLMTPFTPVSHALIKQGFTLIEATVFGEVYRYTQMSGRRCYASQGRIAQNLGLSVATVKRALRRLKKAGLIVDSTPGLRNVPHTYVLAGQRDSAAETKAAQIYRALVGRKVSPATREFIRNVASEDNFDLSVWEATIREWVAHGFNPTNIMGITDLYHQKRQIGAQFDQATHSSERAMKEVGGSSERPTGSSERPTGSSERPTLSWVTVTHEKNKRQYRRQDRETTQAPTPPHDPSPKEPDGVCLQWDDIKDLGTPELLEVLGGNNALVKKVIQRYPEGQIRDLARQAVVNGEDRPFGRTLYRLMMTKETLTADNGRDT